MLVIDSVHQGVRSTSSITPNALWWPTSKVWKIFTSFGNRLVFNWYIEVGVFYPYLFFFRLTKFLVFLLTTNFETWHDNVVFETGRKETAPTQVLIRIQNEVFNESVHYLRTARLHGNAVQWLVLFNRGATKISAECSLTVLKRLVLAGEIIVTNWLVRSDSQTAYNRE